MCAYDTRPSPSVHYDLMFIRVDEPDVDEISCDPQSQAEAQKDRKAPEAGGLVLEPAPPLRGWLAWPGAAGERCGCWQRPA